MRTVDTQQGTIKEWEIGRYPKRPPPHRQRHGCSISRRGPSTTCATAQQFPSWTKASQSYELSRLQSLLQIQSRAAALMLVREDPGILELSPAFIMQRLVDLKESRPTEDPADLIFMEPDLLVEHPADEAYCIAQGRAVNAVRIFRGTHPDAIYLSKEIKNLAIPPHRRIADIIKYVPLFYRVQRPVLRTGLADRGSVTRLRNLLVDFNSACYELKRDQQAMALLYAAMQRQSIEGTLSRGTLLQLEGDDLREALSKVLIPPGRKTKVHMVDSLCTRLEIY
ncbi:g2335 [Coccomyxa viridis]|uniref:G2335 protein n=1 Tax=Coccomyxa viridis TaxID=1274662 RepID=A0ABP1FNU6_9CHLO